MVTRCADRLQGRIDCWAGMRRLAKDVNRQDLLTDYRLTKAARQWPIWMARRGAIDTERLAIFDPGVRRDPAQARE